MTSSMTQKMGEEKKRTKHQKRDTFGWFCIYSKWSCSRVPQWQCGGAGIQLFNDLSNVLPVILTVYDTNSEAPGLWGL